MKLIPIILSLAVLLPWPAAAAAPAGPPTASGTSQTTAVSPTGPRIQFDSVNFDFGRVKSGEVVRHDFIFTNAGSAMLEILDVKPGCGCTTAGEWDKRVEPGKTGRIPLQFNSTAFSGLVAKSATINCNDANQTNVVVLLRGTVWKPIDVQPTMAVFTFSSDVQKEESRFLSITNNTAAPIALTDLQSTNAAFRAELKTLKEGWDFELRICAVPPFTNTVVSQVTLKTSSTELPAISATACAVVQPVIAVAPQEIVLPAASRSNNFTAVVSIRNSGSNAVSLSEGRVNAPGVDVRLQETQPGRAFTLTVVFPPDFQVQPGQKAELSLRTTHPLFPTLTVPVLQSGAVVAAAPNRVAPGPVATTRRMIPLRQPRPVTAPVTTAGN
jgi:hypothetical protein